MHKSVLAWCGIASLALFALAPSAASAQSVPTISASGQATESRAPDQAEVSVGVQATGKTSAEAQDSLNKAMDKVILAVKATKLADLLVQTQGVTLQPEYEESGSRRPPRITGYRASNTIRARTSDVDKVGTLLDVAVAAGANQVWGINFSLKNAAAARHDAILAATADAKARAEAVAEGLGVKLGRVLSAGTGAAQVRPFFSRQMAAMDGGFTSGATAATPVQAGEVTVSADVTVEFAIESNK
ncbi:MAG TPA: SIMPL domain-containing protein [Phycisphaerales bacterium]|nr:SIMPL domain-containing protein [Phycisphaerales bacterium]